VTVSLPDFLLIGAPKAGTTALHAALSRHPELFLSSPKEPKFFLTEQRPPIARGGPGDVRTIRQQVWRRADYERLFAAAPDGVRRGESTTLYLGDPDAHRRIRALIPDAQLIAILRDPIDRAHSNWTHLRSAGLEPQADFLTACSLEQQRKAAGWAPFWRYLELGRYGEQLEHLFSVFPREQVLVLFYRELREDPVGTIDRVTTFLGVAPGHVTDVPAENVTVQSTPSAVNAALSWLIRQGFELGQHLPGPLSELLSAAPLRVLQREQRARSPLTPAERIALLPEFEDDIRSLESLLQHELPHWRDPRNGTGRRPLQVTGRFGTAYRSIDRPL
jgi:hypothetical protein